jgi:hypothetical protein
MALPQPYAARAKVVCIWLRELQHRCPLISIEI